LRQLAAAVLAVPILLSVYAVAALRRPVGRLAILVVMVGFGGILGIGSLAPARTTADQPVAPSPLPVAAFNQIHVQQGLRAPVMLSFSTPMDEASVRAALRIDPAVPVDATFDAAGTGVTIAPAAHWAPGTYYTVTIGQDARDRSGRQLSAPVQTAFLTRPAASARLFATGEEGGAVPLDARFVVTVEGDVPAETLAAAIDISPSVPGTVSVTGAGEPSARGGDPVSQVIFTPSAPLAAGLKYTVSLASLVDADGAPLIESPAMVVTTASAPSVVRFRPAAGATSVPLAAPISVRFTQAMDRASTQAAFSATVGGASVTGTFDWAEKGTVLVFKPAKPFDYSKTVALSVGATALSARGVPLVAVASAKFTTIAKPAPKPAPKPAAKPAAKPVAKPAAKPAPKPVPIASGGSVAGGTWAAVEAYYLRLLNCTRTGGWVTTSGSCLPGSNGTPPLAMSAALQTRVARPYAKVLATTGACSHTADGTFAYRLARGGFSGYIWAGENVGCGNGDPYKAMIADHLFFQNEKSTNGGHYRNIMDPRFRVVGVGVWVYAGRCRLVTDFLDP
jgi:uncharacterized protein YkwD